MRSDDVSVGWFPLVFLSGAAALIYQVTWQRYLGILLGTQSKSIAIVLAIFLAGMSLGYFTFGRFTQIRRWNLLTAFAITEVLLAFWGVCFPLLFKGAQALTAAYYARLGVESVGIDLLCALALLGPPTFLMGGTLPLLTQGLSADANAASRLHARIYGWNTVGAAFGAWLAGYFLIPLTDLPVTVTIAGLFNTVVGAVSYFGYARHLSVPVRKAPARAKRQVWDRRGWILLGIALVSGFCVFTLENVFVRLVGLATGPSQTGFTLVVSIFVLALGLGSLWVRRVGEWGERHLLWNLLAVATTLLALYFSADYWPYWVHRVRIVFRDIPAAYSVFQIAVGGLFFLLFLVPIALCGLTLPLCFHLLKEKAETLGDRVGRLYAFNSLGCILGAVAGYWLLTWLNLDQLFRLCTLLFMVSAVAVLAIAGFRPFERTFQLATVWVLALAVGVFFSSDLDRRMFLQAFRQTRPTDDGGGREGFARTLARVGETIFYKDGPEATVAVVRSPAQGKESTRSVIINGKSDGSTGGDRMTMSLSAHLPGLFAPRLDRACVIGFGTGVTAGELASYSENRSVDVVELSGTLLKHASLFDAYNGGVSQNPKVHLHQMDAFRFLSAGEPYDVIISEPSNPWVAGVENLFTTEYYQLAKQRLAGDGVFVQWLQLYSFEDALVRRVFATLSQSFSYVRVFKMLDSDIALVASNRPIGPEAIARADGRWKQNPNVATSLQSIGLASVEVALGLELLPPSLVFVAAQGSPIYRLDTPRLSTDAARAQFLGKTASLVEERRKIPTYGLAQQELLLSRLSPRLSFEQAEVFRKAFCDHPVAKSRILCEEVLVYEKFLRPDIAFERAFPDSLRPEVVVNLELLRPPGKITKVDRVDLSAIHSAVQTFRTYTSALAPLPTEGLEARLDACLVLNRADARVAGECLIEKIALLEFSRPGSQSWGRTVNQYRQWFATLSKDTPDYGVFAEVAQALKGAEVPRGIASDPK